MSGPVILYSWNEWTVFYRIQEDGGQKSVWMRGQKFSVWTRLGNQWRFLRNMSSAEYNLFYREQAERQAKEGEA